MLDNVNQRLANNGIHLSVTEKVKEKLVDLGYDPKMGARPLRRTTKITLKMLLLTSTLKIQMKKISRLS